MKSKRIVIAGAAVLLLGPGVGLCQEGSLSEFSGTEAAKDPTNPVASLAFRGAIRCLGAGNPTPSDQIAPPYCPAGTWTSAKARVLTMRWTTSDPNTTGLMTYIMYFNVDSNTYSGNWWGSFVLEVPGKGEWEGTFVCESTGRRPDGVGALAACRLIANGDGEFQRWHLMAEVNYGAMFLRPATVAGRYMRPNSRLSGQLLPLGQAGPWSFFATGATPLNTNFWTRWPR